MRAKRARVVHKCELFTYVIYVHKLQKNDCKVEVAK